MFKFLLIFLITFPAMACGDHFFARVGAGTQGMWTSGGDDWDDNDKLAAVMFAGYRATIVDGWAWDLTYTHNSQWTQGWPVDDRGEDVLDSISLGLEYRIY